MPRTVSLGSNEMINAIGMLNWASNGYHFEGDRPYILNVMMNGWPGLTRSEWHKLLTGETKFQRRGESVVIELELDADKVQEAIRIELMDEVFKLGKENYRMREALEEISEWTGRGTVRTNWREIVESLGKTAREALSEEE